MKMVRSVVWVVMFVFLVAAVGCGGDTPTDTSENKAPAQQGESQEKPAEEAASSKNTPLPKDAKEVTVSGDVYHYTIDPCAIASAEEVETFLGKPFTTKFSFVYGIPPYTRCEYAVELPEEERAGRSPDTLAVSVVEPLTLAEAGFPGLDTAAEAFNRHKKALNNAGAEIEEVPDLGDDAFVQSSDGVLHLLAGDVYLRVSASIYTNETAPTLDELHRKLADNNAKVAKRFAAELLLPNLKGS